jgi:5-methylthioadenosine/S-adenosylhomocysteine deaminase
MPERTKSRRNFLAAGVGAVAGASLLPAQTFDRLIKSQADPKRRVLLRGGIVMSLDPKVGDFESADVLIEGKKILAVGPNLAASSSSALVVDAAGMIVMPGFVDTHHHQYETVLRGILADGVLGPVSDGPRNYMATIQGVFTPIYLPEDAHISELVASLNQINAGVTTTVDTSQVSLTPAHTDACIAGLRESGRRAVFAYAAGVGPASQFPRDIVRLRKQYFASGDQLLTLALNAQPSEDQWKLARSVGAPIVSHIVGGGFGDLMSVANAMGPDNEYIHCTQLSEDTWKRIADTGGKVSVAPAIEMQMRHGMPPLQQALDHGIRPSLSVDVECNMAADMFTIMRTAFTLQRAMVNERGISGEKNVPRLLTCRDTIELATIEGARVAHLDGRIGTLTPGKEADIVMLATDRINVFPLNNAPGAVVTLMDTSNVENVFIAGKLMKWRGKLVGVDLDRIRRMTMKARDGLLARANYKRDMFGSCCAVG